jgi:hypothetical protein
VLKTNALECLEEIARAGIIPHDLDADLKEALGLIALLRIGQHLEAHAHGAVLDNFVGYAALNKLQRKMLNESFAVINQLSRSSRNTVTRPTRCPDRPGAPGGGARCVGRLSPRLDGSLGLSVEGCRALSKEGGGRAGELATAPIFSLDEMPCPL